jgi:hypothetical protein
MVERAFYNDPQDISTAISGGTGAVKDIFFPENGWMNSM